MGAFFRQTLVDGLYGYAGTLYRSPGASRARLIGQQGEVDLNYSVSKSVLLRVIYEHFFAGSFLHERPPGKDVNHVTIWLDHHF